MLKLTRLIICVAVLGVGSQPSILSARPQESTLSQSKIFLTSDGSSDVKNPKSVCVGSLKKGRSTVDYVRDVPFSRQTAPSTVLSVWGSSNWALIRRDHSRRCNLIVVKGSYFQGFDPRTENANLAEKYRQKRRPALAPCAVANGTFAGCHYSFRTIAGRLLASGKRVAGFGLVPENRLFQRAGDFIPIQQLVAETEFLNDRVGFEENVLRAMREQGISRKKAVENNLLTRDYLRAKIASYSGYHSFLGNMPYRNWFALFLDSEGDFSVVMGFPQKNRSGEIELASARLLDSGEGLFINPEILNFYDRQ